MNQSEFGEVMGVLMDFYDKKPPKAQLEAWFWKTKHLDASVAIDAADEVTSHLAMFPTPAKFLDFADQVRARKSGIENRQGDQDARRFFSGETAPPGFGKDCVAAINEMLATPKNDHGAYLKTKYDVAKRMLEKYPNMAEDAKHPLKAMMREAKEETRKLLNQEDTDSINL